MTTTKTKAPRRRQRSEKAPLPKDIVVLLDTAKKAKDPYERGLVMQRRAMAVQKIRSGFRVLEGGLAA